MGTNRQIMHVCSYSRPETQEFEATLAGSDVQVVRVPDCYAAMADLVRKGPKAYEAILLPLAELAASDQEFLQLASHRYRSTPIYVYGLPSGEITTAWAMQAGARGGATSTELRALFAARPAPSESTSTPEVRPALDRVNDLVLQEIVRPLQQPHAPPVTPAVAQEPPRAESIGARREESTQLRRKPAGVGPANQAPPFEAEVGPLLSPEELRALLGDDAEDDAGSD